MNKVLYLRVIHGLFTVYFIFCLVYIYYAALFSKFDLFLLVAVVSLCLEGFAVFILNKGDCPLIHVQKKIGDNTPFFNLFLPEKLAKQAIPTLVKVAYLGFALLVLRLVSIALFTR